MKSWWSLRTEREKILLVIMALIAIPILAWFLVIAPLADAEEQARVDYLAALDRNARVEALLGITDSPPAPALGMPLTTYLDEAATQRGFDLATNTEETPGQVRISISQASGDAALGWLRQLEAQGLKVRNLQITPGNNGGISLSMTVAAGGQ